MLQKEDVVKKFFTSVFILCASLYSVNVNKADEASTFVKKVVEEAIAIVNDDSMPDAAKRQKLSECINKYLDIPRITQSVFAPLGFKDLSGADKAKVQKYLKEYLVRFYAGEGKLSAMVNARLVDYPVAKIEDKDFAVTSRFTKGLDGKSTEIIWITDSKLIYYVKIEGVNQIITLRSEMSAAVGNGKLMDYINAQG